MNPLLAYYQAPGGLLIVLLILLLLLIPAWPYSREWGYRPLGLVGIILIVLLILMVLPACTKDTQGNYHLDPGVRNQLLTVASVEAHGLASDYLTTGNVDFKKDLISGALSQVYSLEGSATPATQANVATVVGQVITDPGLQAAVTKAAVNTINAAPKGTAKTPAINGALAALDAAIAKASGG